MVGTATYDPYGNITVATGTALPLGFAGEHRDSESGLIYLRARYYDPSTGQFLSRDPIAATTRNAYGYTPGNPLNRIDPTGLYEYQHTEKIGTVQQTGGAEAVMHYVQSHMAQVFPFSTGDCTEVILNAQCDLTPFPFVDDPVQVTACDATSFTFTTVSGNKQIGERGTITFSTYEQNGFVLLRQTAHAPNADWLTNVVAPIISADTWSEMARRVRQQLKVGSDGGSPLPGGLTPEECWSSGVCGS